MLHIYDKALELLEQGRRFALASVVYSQGSTPQKAGANAIFEATGEVHGTLGGGCLEAEARRRALDALDLGQPLVFNLELDEVDGWDDGLVCGGRVRVLVQPGIDAQAPVYRKGLDAQRQKRPGLLITILQHPQHAAGTALWLEEAQLQDQDLLTDAAPLQKKLLEGKSGTLRGLLDGSEVELYIEPVLPPPRLIIAGAGHIGKALSHLGALLEFEVTVVDDRALFASPENLPDAHSVRCGNIVDELTALDLGPRDYVVIVTRGHQNDGRALAACVHAPVAYLGLIGSRRKSLLLRRRLLEEGLASEEEVARVVTPMGLDIGASSVQEIALSIAAQLVAVRRKQSLHAAPLALPLTV